MYSKLEFIAIPYTDPDPKVEGQRCHIVQYVCSKYALEGRFVYSPIAMFNAIAKKFEMPTDWRYMRTLCLTTMLKCNNLVILTLGGWETAEGIQEEIEVANDHAMKVEYVDPTPYIKDLRKLGLRYVYYIDNEPHFDVFK